MKKQILKIMLCFGIIAINYSCDSSIYIENNETEVIDYGYIPISQYNVDDSGFTTQEGNTILKTDFKGNTKKKLGVFVIEDNQITQSNVPISYTDGLWRGKLMITKENAKVYAYYPYRTDFFDILATELDPTAENAETFFARYISNKDIATTYADADLQVGAGTLTNDTLSFMLNHQLSVIELAPQEGFVKIGYYLKSDPDYTWGNKEQEIYVSEVKIKDGKDFIQKDGKYYYFFKPENSMEETEISFKLNEIPEETTINANGLNAGNAISQVIGPEKTDQTIAHELNVGDFFMKDGSIKAFDATLTDLDKLNCIGIVFQTDINRIGQAEKEALADKGVNTPHALVMALNRLTMKNFTGGDTGSVPWFTRDAKSWWGNADNIKDLPQESASDINGINNLKTIVDIYNDISGLANCNAIRNEFTGSDEEFAKYYPAFYYANFYPKVEDIKEIPEKTTGWFIPSAGQWWDIFTLLGKLDGLNELKEASPNTGASAAFDDKECIAAKNINIQLNKVGGTYIYIFSETESKYYLTSSETDWDKNKGQRVITARMQMGSTQKNVGYYPDGKYENREVRLVLAF